MRTLQIYSFIMNTVPGGQILSLIDLPTYYNYIGMCIFIGSIHSFFKLCSAGEEEKKKQDWNKHVFGLSIALAIGYYFRLPSISAASSGSREKFCELVDDKLYCNQAFRFNSIIQCLLDRFYQNTDIPGISLLIFFFISYYFADSFKMALLQHNPLKRICSA